MPVRKIPLISGEYYHVFNHGIDYINICNNDREYQRLLLTLWFYQPVSVQVKLSQYLNFRSEVQQDLINEINDKPKIIEVHTFALVQNHYHLLLRQLVDNGISTFIGNIQNSFTKYFNVKHHRRGSLFLTPFRAKRIQTQEQMIHTSRYIHLNRYSSGFIRNLEKIKTDPYTSLPYYLNSLTSDHRIITTNQIENYFSSEVAYWNFIRDQADYQRELDHIKHLIEE